MGKTKAACGPTQEPEAPRPQGGARGSPRASQKKPFFQRETNRHPKNPQTRDKTPKWCLIPTAPIRRRPILGPVDVVIVAIGPSVLGRVAKEYLWEQPDLTNMWQRSWIPEESAVHHGANQVMSLGNTSPDGGNSPVRTPRPDEFLAEKLEPAAQHGGERQEPPAAPSNRGRREQGLRPRSTE
jgi:hypothetical protein